MQRKQEYVVAPQPAIGYISILHSDVYLTDHSELWGGNFRSEDDEPFPVSV